MDLKKELISYTFFGILTSVINIVVYLLFTDSFHINYIVSNIIAWAISVLFAYVTNRIWVFESKNENIVKEIFLFYSGRFFTVIVDTAFMILFIDFLHFGNSFSKIVVAIIVIILNYVISKLVVFK